MLGRQIVKQLGQDPQKWKKVYALSRSKKIDYPSNVEHRHIDLTSDAKEMAKELEGVEAEYVFFAAYLQQDSEQGSWNVNGEPGPEGENTRGRPNPLNNPSVR